MRYRKSTPLLLETITLKTLSLVLNAHSGTTRELGKEKVLEAVQGSADWAKVIVSARPAPNRLTTLPSLAATAPQRRF